MKIEKIKKDNKKNIVIIILAVIAVTSTIMHVGTRAKYQTIDSIPLASGTVSLSKYDLQIVAMYQESDTGTITLNGKSYIELGSNDRMPSGNNYTISSNSYCYTDNKDVHDTEVELTTIDGHHVIENLKKNEKCYLYFDKIKSLAENLIATADKTSITTSADFGVMEPRSGVTPAPGLYEFDGITEGFKTQFYRGAVTNNYVKLGKDSSNYTYWRIIRFDEEGNIRLIYDGTSVHDNGEASNDRVLTTNFDGTNMYKAKYHSTKAEANVKWSNSEIKSYLENTWLPAFEERLSDKEKLQLTTGKFCSDSSIRSVSGGTKYYGAYGRLQDNNTPLFRCASGNTTTSKVGMLSADEYSFAGGGGHNQTNTSFYLFTGASCWTLSPYTWTGTDARVFYVSGDHLSWYNVGNDWGVRPVLTLEKHTKFDPDTNGTKDNPYVIV